MNTIESNIKKIQHDKLDSVILLKFSAKWCQPCKKIQPVINEVVKKLVQDTIEKKQIFYQATIDIMDPKNLNLINKYNVKKIPYMALCKTINKHTETFMMNSITFRKYAKSL